MYRVWDVLNRPIQPTVTLCNPNGSELFILNGIKDRNISLRFNDVSEFTFKAYKHSGVGSINEYYSQLQTRRLIKIEKVGMFIITNVSNVGNGIFEHKEVKAQSLQKEIARKNVGYLDGTYKFYDIVKPEGTLLNELIKLIPSWKLDYIDSSLMSLYRTFKVTSDTSLYNFMIKDVEEAYQCVFKFDSFNKTISVYAVENAVVPTDILMTYKNLVKEIKVEESEDELATALAVFGGGDLGIHKVNPLGTSSIYDFSYYKNTNWMTHGLIDALNKWESKVLGADKGYAELLNRLKEENSKLLTMNVELTELKTQLDVLNQELSILIQANGDVSGKKNQISAKESEIKSKESQIKAQELVVKGVSDAMADGNNNLSFDTNFTKDQLEELSMFIVQGEYTDDSFIQTDEMTDVQKVEMSQALYDQAQKVLRKVSQPRYSFSLSAVNFLNMKEFKPFIDQVELGCEVTIDMGDGLFAYPVLLEMRYSLDDESQLDLTFSNRLRLKRDDFVFEELFGKTISTSSSVNHESFNWGQGAEANSKVNELINSMLDTSKKKIISSTDLEMTMDHTGIRGRKLDKATEIYSPNEMWLTQNTLGFTRDGWNTCCTAIGELELNGIKQYGICAPYLVGRMLIGQELLIENESSTFKVTGDKVLIKNADLIITTEDGVDIPFEDKFANDINNVVIDMNGKFDDINQVIADGIITTYYQGDMPQDGSKGDLWFKTGEEVGSGKLYRHNDKLTSTMDDWDLITDPDITKAMEEASKAKEAADGKITSYYQDEAPVNGQIVNNKPIVIGVGDLWIDTKDGNKLYRWDGYKWVDASAWSSKNIIVNSEPSTASLSGWQKNGNVHIYNWNNIHREFWLNCRDGSPGYRGLFTKYYECKENTTYTLSYNVWVEGTGSTEGANSLISQLKTWDFIPDSMSNGDFYSNGGTYIKGIVHPDNNRWDRVSFTFTTGVSAKVLMIGFTMNYISGALGKIIKVQLEEGDVATEWTRNPDDNIFLNTPSVPDVFTPDGNLDSSKMEGFILAGKSNIVCSNNTTGRKVVLNENGILVGATEYNGKWIGNTAITAEGVVAERIKAGNITGCNIVGTNVSIGEVKSTLIKLTSSGINIFHQSNDGGLFNGKYMEMRVAQYSTYGTGGSLVCKRLTGSSSPSSTEYSWRGVDFVPRSSYSLNEPVDMFEINSATGVAIKSPTLESPTTSDLEIKNLELQHANHRQAIQQSALEVTNMELEYQLQKQGVSQSELEIMLVEKGILQ